MSKTLTLKYQSILQNAFAFFFKPDKYDHYFLPFFRISIGLFTLIHFLSILPDFNILYVNRLIPFEISSLYKLKMLPAFSDFILFTKEAIGLTEAMSVHVFISLFILFSLFLTIGLFTRFSAILLLLFYIMLGQGGQLFAYGVDAFNIISLFYCCVFPVGRYISMDMNIFNLQEVNPTPYRRLLQIHMCIVYFVSGIDKAIGPSWWNGESIWKSVHLPYFGTDMAINYDFMANYPLIPMIIGWGTIFTELFYPFFIWRKKTSMVWLTLVVCLHLSIMISLNLYFFATLMILLNFSAFFQLDKRDYATVNLTNK